MRLEEVRYLRDCIDAHVARFFTFEARARLSAVPVHWVALSSVRQPSERAVFIPIDVPAGVEPGASWSTPFGGSELTLWNRLEAPSPEWVLDDPERPLWYRHPCGALYPSWNLAANLFDLLTLREERESAVRDVHGRFTSSMSPRAQAGLLASPIFNDSVAALVAACDALASGQEPVRTLREGLALAPALVLSHDLDQLRGNDVWTQAARLSRILRPRTPGQRLANAWYAVENAVRPKRYYWNNIVGMIAIERMLGFTSTLYFLNGSGGRYGARSGSSMIAAAASLAPRAWPRGMHYNYDTYLDRGRFDAQRRELETLLGEPMRAGRAHYLRFDSQQSWRFLLQQGIRVDESLGYPDAVAYRAGIAGPYCPYDADRGEAMPLLEMPMVAMESTLAAQGPEHAVQTFTRMLGHLQVVGGGLSLLFHPGQFHNPEYPETLGLYRRLLGIARDIGARSMHALAWIE